MLAARIRRLTLRLLLAPVLPVAGCGASTGGPLGAAGQPDPSQTACSPGQVAHVDGSCSAVGPAAPPMATAFVRSQDGWGYDAVAGSACKSDELAALGQASCVPVDDCSAPFPPPQASFVVSQALTGPNVVPTLDQALSQMPAGGVVALDAGSYPPVSINADVTIVGRCATVTTLGDGVHNAIYVNGTHVVLRSLALTSSSSAIAVARGSVQGERLILRNSHVSVGVAGAGSTVTLKDSLVIGLNSDSLGGMAMQGGHLVIDSSEIRAVTLGLLATDPGSNVEVRNSVVSIVDSATSSGMEASAHGNLQAEGVLVRSTAARLAAVHADTGTVSGATSASGSMTVNASVLEQQGAELLSAPAVDLQDGGDLTLTDTTLRHQARIGILAAGGKATLTRVSVLGNPATASLRAALYAGHGVHADVEALAVPWAQGGGVMVDTGTTLGLSGSLVANVERRDEGEEAILVSGGNLTVTGCEVSGNQQEGLVAIAGATVSVGSTLIRDSASTDGSSSAGAVVLHSSATFDGSVFARNGEGIDAAGSAVAVTGTVFRAHQVALRAMDGMQLLEGTSDLTDDAIAFAGCQFIDDDAKTSSDTLPQLDAPPFPSPTSGK
jgi:hypothetical protein